MANADLEPSGLIARTSALLNNSVLSDVEFHVKNGSNIEKFHAHRLILAVSGKGFFDLLSNATNSSTIIKISDLSPHAVYLMLKYLYTDSLSLLKMEDAIELFRLAKKYSITDLEKICCKYIMKEEINIDNLFVKYESALACNFDELLQNCRKLVQSETKAVFASKYFGHASFSVIEDILSQNCLNVSSELEVIHAALKWSECECKRKGRPTEKICVRDAIEPLLKYLRFLSLTADEFCDFVEKYNIFTGYESTLFTRKILQPQTNVPLSKQFCSITRPRQAYARSNSSMVNATNFNDYYADFLKSPDPFFVKKHEQSPPTSLKNETPFFQLNPRKSTPMLKVMPQNASMRRTFDFPLEEMQKNLGFASLKDVKCNAEIRMTRGSILIHGIDLKITDQKDVTDESIEVFSYVSGSNFTSKVETHTLKLKNNMLTLIYPEPIKVSVNYPINIEITVEDLHLYRCYACKEQNYELNCGLNIMAEISPKSNQLNGANNFLYLINRIIYSTS